MSGPTSHEREPDRAALDELERAFAGEVAERANPGVALPSDDPAGDASRDPSVDPSHGGRPTQPVGPSVEGGSATPGIEATDDDARTDDPDPDPDDDQGDDPDPDPDDDQGDDDRAGSERAPGAEELVIVEAEPLADQPPEPHAPKTIRIDGYGGSVVIDDVPAGTGAIDHDHPAPGPARPIDLDAEPIVIAIDDEELPDAVYFEGSLDGSGSRSIVLIEDDDTGDTIGPESERDIRRGIEPRMRERRVAVKRAQGRKRLKWAAIASAAVIIVVGTLALLGSGLFAIEEDQVFLTGNVYTDPEQLQSVIDDLVGTPVLVADTQGAERELESIPWVDEARVRTDFPHGVTIEIREREAISTFRGPDLLFRVLDRDGRVLDVIDKFPIAYVLIGGPDPVDLDPGEFAPRGYAAASELSKNLTGSVRGRVDRIDVAADGTQLVMYLVDGVEVRFGEARDLFAKLVRLETVLSSGGASESTVIDVSTNEVTL